MLFTESELIKIVTHKDTHATAKQAKDMQLLNDVYSVTNCNDEVFLFFLHFPCPYKIEYDAVQV
jgi:hypothetical protein